MGDGVLSDDLYKSTTRLVLDYGKTEYADVCQNWRDIESKAQGVAAIAGIFIGGVFAILENFAGAPCWALSVLAGVLLALVAAVLCALRALFVSECECLDDTSTVYEQAEQVLEAQSEDTGKTEIRKLAKNIGRMYCRVNAEVHRANRKKANWVLGAQTCVALGVVAATIVILVRAFSNWV